MIIVVNNALVVCSNDDVVLESSDIIVEVVRCLSLDFVDVNDSIDVGSRKDMHHFTLLCITQ